MKNRFLLDDQQPSVVTSLGTQAQEQSADENSSVGSVFSDMNAAPLPDASDNPILPLFRTLFRIIVLVVVILSGISVFTGIWIPVVSDAGKLLGKFVFNLVDGSASRLGLVMVIFILTNFLFRRSKSSQ